MAFKMKGFTPFTKKTGDTSSLEQGLGNDEDMIRHLEEKERKDVGEETMKKTRKKRFNPNIEGIKEDQSEKKYGETTEDETVGNTDVKETDSEEEEKDDDLPFKMSVSFSSPFTKTKDDPVDKNWKENQSIMDDLKSLKDDLRDAKSEEEKRKIQMDIDQTQKIIDEGYEESSQLNPNNPDRD